jgi:hypothetical protein
MNVTAERTGTASRRLTPWHAPAATAANALSDEMLAARRRTATVVGLLALGGAVALFAALIVRANGGTFTYVIDDPYIHLTIARNLASNGTYGIVPGVFESASSSPGWVALLTGLIRVVPGAAEWFPLALNVLAAAGVLVLVVRSQRFLFTIEPAVLRGVFYALLPVAMFLPGLVLLGMEHSLHALLVVALLLLLGRALQRPLSGRELAGTVTLALLAGAVRYETLFLAGGATVALLLLPGAPGGERARGVTRVALARLRRREVWAFLLPPLLVTALLAGVNLHNGQYALPNSVLAKSGLGAGHGLEGWVPNLYTSFSTLTGDLLAGSLMLIGLGYLAVRRLRGTQSGLWLAWIVMAALHVGYAKFGWFDRYQGYLVVSGMLLALRTLPELRRLPARSFALAGAVVLVGLPAPKYSLQAQIPQYAHLIYQHQYAMGRFFGAEYAGAAVMVNDIGEVSWQHSGGLDDLWALGSYDVLRAYRTGEMGRGFVAHLAARDHVQAVAIWGALSGYIPASFVEVARWSISGTGSPNANNDVVFYAPSRAQAATLQSRMRSFAGSGSLPAGVEVLWSSASA